MCAGDFDLQAIEETMHQHARLVSNLRQRWRQPAVALVAFTSLVNSPVHGPESGDQDVTSTHCRSIIKVSKEDVCSCICITDNPRLVAQLEYAYILMCNHPRL